MVSDSKKNRQKVSSQEIIHLGLRKRIAALVLGFLAVLLRFVRETINLFQPRASAKVLILEPFGLGDVISLEPLARSLGEKKFQVIICARLEWRVLYGEEVTWMPSRIPWGYHQAQMKYRLADYFSPAFRRFMKELRQAGRGSIGLDPRGDIRSVILLYLAGCRKVITLSNYLGSDLAMFAGAAKQIPFSSKLRRWEMNLNFLQALGVAEAKPSPPFFKHLGSGPSESSRRVAIIPVAPWPGKFWESTKWQELIKQLPERGWRPRGLCGPGQKQIAESETGKAIEFSECSSIESWAKQLNQFSAVVTLDTGPMHLADALGIPVIALFGASILPLWAPNGKRSRVIAHHDDPDFQVCHPVDENLERARGFMRRITVEEVLQALESLETPLENAKKE